MTTNAERVQSAYAAFARGDIPAIVELVSEDVDWSSPKTLPQGGRFHSRDGVLKFFEAVGAAWSSLTLDVEVVDELGTDRVVGIVRASGTLRSGGPGTYAAAHVFDLRDGQIARFREYVDIDVAIGG